ncbi:hypothetical protein GLOTRDRAFT_137554 [Gloeophyllum trabeum ATCC 11539]|uniref:Uncharacterized protein n=1 Tax=Gloeophyllum trabeum (strain ATCC 11539 / FP-39264 / Madison 617) TaxID=670483 RepID=S7QCN3_GLOTA|nr:uncharacterized protein GLOTRDRAFT_137554 [Gloeophyllum trabeum ATCC 11539]EPQ57153.1 hypothetical protein GLOTRDRAFT_137554 [Gloeophyllum trabeum ATCC 11539]
MLSSRPVSIHADGPAQLGAKTPGRPLAKGRNALQENAVLRGVLPATVKARKVATHHTPFHTKSTKHPGSSKTGSKSILLKTTSKPLLDKTPFPNRTARTLRTPELADEKIAKLSFLDVETDVPGSSQQQQHLRPSSSRKSLRLPRSATSIKFRTPVTTGNHWDVSDGEVQVQAENADAEQEAVEVEDDDEIEYMPPTAIIPPYEPPFEMPDYKVLGKELLQTAFSYPYDDGPPPALDLSVYDEKFFASMEAECELELPELDDDNLLPAEKRPSSSATKSSDTRTTRSRTVKVSSNTTSRASPETAPTRRPITRAAAKGGTTPGSSETQPRALSTRSPLMRATSVASTRPTTRSAVKATAVARPATSTSTYRPSLADIRKAGGQTRTAAKATSGQAAAVGVVRRATSTAGRATLAAKTSSAAARHTKTDSVAEEQEVDGVLLFDEQGIGGDDFLFDV